MKPPFDIAGDLDTPVSAFAKLGAFNPRFLLESVEGGERLARYSFIGFGKCLEVKLDASGLQVGNAKLPRPANKAELLDALRKALSAAPKPLPEMAGVPLAGGLVGYSSYDVVRYFERQWCDTLTTLTDGYTQPAATPPSDRAKRLAADLIELRRRYDC